MQALLAKYGIKNPRGGAECGAGWLPIIESLIVDLIAMGWDKNVQQIKEKFGELRFYVGEASAEMQERISDAAALSAVTCETCGKPGTISDKGWAKARCEEHRGAVE